MARRGGTDETGKIIARNELTVQQIKQNVKFNCNMNFDSEHIFNRTILFSTETVCLKPGLSYFSCILPIHETP